MSRKRIVTVVGARPQFVKAAAVSRALAASETIEELLIHTGQHYDYDMSDIFFEELGIPAPARNLGVGSGPHGRQTGEMLAALGDVLDELKPDAVLVYGDTNSTLAGALAGAKLHIPVVHSEAGLRSFNKKMPEEINRLLTDHVSALLLCPTTAAVANLAREGLTENVLVTGDVMYDAALFARDKAETNGARDRLGLRDEPYALCTIHRAENTDDPVRFARIIAFIDVFAQDMRVVVPMHPRTRAAFRRAVGDRRSWMLIDPLGYLDLHAVLAGAELVLTDSGGLQKEAYFHRKPCITLRDETEWVETVEAGWNRLWTAPDWKTPRRDIADYGAGDAAIQSIREIERLLS